MRLSALAGLALLAAFALSARADDKDAKKAFEQLVVAWHKDRDAAAPAERRKVAYDYADKFLAHAEKYSKDPSAVEAAVLVTRLVRPGRSETRTKALELLKGDVGKQAAVRRWLRALTSNPLDDEGLTTVQSLAKSHPDKTTRAWAMHAASKGFEGRSQLAERLEKDETFREQLEKQQGKDVVKSLMDRATNARFRARQLRTRLNKEHPGVFPDLSIGKPIPELVAEDLDGKKVKLSDLKGKVVVLDFWATWCGYCIKMIPHERELVKKMKDKPFVLVSISADDSKDKVKKFIDKTPMPWTHWYVGDQADVLTTWEIEGFPTILVVDHKGVIRYKDVRDEKMDEAVTALLKEAEDKKD